MLRRWLERLSPRGERLLINLLCFALPISTSIGAVIQRHRFYVYDTRRAISGIVYELLVMAIALAVLRIRGWRFRDFRLDPSIAGTFGGFLFFFGYTTLWIAMSMGLYFAGLRLQTASMRFTARAELALLFCVINPFFEELFVLAYNMKAMEGENAAAATTFSAFVRFLYHLYQGPLGAVMILLFGLGAGVVFRRWRTLWPIVIGHMVLDIVAMFLRR